MANHDTQQLKVELGYEQLKILKAVAWGYYLNKDGVKCRLSVRAMSEMARRYLTSEKIVWGPADREFLNGE